MSLYTSVAGNPQTTAATGALNNATAALTFSVTTGDGYSFRNGSYIVAWDNTAYPAAPESDPNTRIGLLSLRTMGAMTVTWGQFGTPVRPLAGQVKIAQLFKDSVGIDVQQAMGDLSFLWGRGGREFNVKEFGAVGDTQLVVDGSIISGSKLLASASGKFKSTDVGKIVTVKGAAAASAHLNTTIAAYISATAVTLTLAASTTVSSAHVIWGTDDLWAFQAAYAAAEPTAANIYAPPGGYGLSSTFSLSPAQSATKSCNVPGLVTDSVPGRIGDGGTSSYLDETNAVSFYPLGAFPQGKLLIDYVSRDNVQSLNGARVGGFGLICESIAAGMRISNTRRFKVADINIDHAAIPTGYSDGSVTAAFNAVQQGGTSTAYNVYDNICTAYSAKDGFSHSAAGDDVFTNCYDLNAVGYAYKCQGFGRFINCHYEQSGKGWYLLGGQKQNMVIGADIFGTPTGIAVEVTSNGNSFPVQFISCNFKNIPGSSPGEEAGSVIAVQNNNQPVVAKFIGCTIGANTNTTDFVYVESAVVAGSKVQFSDCSFLGTPTNKPFNDASGKNVLQFDNCTGIANTAPNAARTTVANVNYTALMSDNIIAYTSLSAGRAVTLPDATYFTGILTVKDEAGSAGANNITLQTSLSQTIDGASTKVINSNYGSAKVYSNGANWFAL